MALYLIGDVQGCDGPLRRLLERIAFSPSRDRLFFLGDMVNRGPDSGAVLRRLMALGGSALCLLGNHDLHLLALAAGVPVSRGEDTLDELLAAPDRGALLDWLKQQHLAWQEANCLMVHAGVPPDWSAAKALALAKEVQAVLRGPDCDAWLGQMYGDEPTAWRDDLAGADRLRCIVNALTRMRFCSAQGVMELDANMGPGQAPPGFLPWFEHLHRQTASTTVAFGHWSSLGLLVRPDLICLDTGCAWGGQLSAMRISRDGKERELIQVACIPA